MPLRRVLRDLVSYLAVLLVVAALGGYAWLTHNPESPVLEAAQEWPVVGGLAQRMRRAYLGEPVPAAGEAGTAGEGADDGDAEEVRIAQGPLHLPPPPGARRITPPRRAVGGSPGTGEGGAAAASDDVPSDLPGLVEPTAVPDLGRIVGPARVEAVPVRHTALAWRWFLPGQPVREEPGAAGGRELPTLAYLPILARDGGWSQVLYRGDLRWMEDGWRPAHSRRAARQGGIRRHVEPPKAASFARLHEARKLLGQRRTERSLGAYQLWTDVEDAELLGFLDELAGVAEDAYFARFARLPSGDPLRSAVLFASEADYREYSGDGILLASHAGHAGGGVLASYTAGRPRAEVASTLVHEITHLLNARALSWDLPPWLEEGMAGAMDAVWVEGAGVDSADGDTVVQSFLGYDGHDGRIVLLAERLRAGTLPPIHLVILADREEFYQGDASVHYALAGALVRFLLEGDAGRYREGFLRFLQRVANGYDANGALLLDSYGTKDTAFVAELDGAFRRWVAGERPAAADRLQRTARALHGR